MLAFYISRLVIFSQAFATNSEADKRWENALPLGDDTAFIAVQLQETHGFFEPEGCKGPTAWTAFLIVCHIFLIGTKTTRHY